MEALALVADVTAVAGLGMGWRWRRRAHAAEAEASRLQADLLAERHAAQHDPLTGLPNRRAFYQLGAAILADSVRHPPVAAILDLNGFKQVNDHYGHAVGDQVLVAVARRLATFAGSDLVARLGGDEFAGLLSLSSTDDHWVQRTARRLAAALSAPVSVTGGTVMVSASVGLAPVHRSGDLADALHRADVAMYRAKTHPVRGLQGTSGMNGINGINGRAPILRH